MSRYRSSSDDSGSRLVGMLIFTAIWCALIGFGACEDEPRTRRILREHGYHDVKTTGYAWFSCGYGDLFNTEFEATAPSGTRVSGAMCCGWWIFKSCTQRSF